MCTKQLPVYFFPFFSPSLFQVILHLSHGARHGAGAGGTRALGPSSICSFSFPISKTKKWPSSQPNVPGRMDRQRQEESRRGEEAREADGGQGWTWVSPTTGRGRYHHWLRERAHSIFDPKNQERLFEKQIRASVPAGRVGASVSTCSGVLVMFSPRTDSSPQGRTYLYRSIDMPSMYVFGRQTDLRCLLFSSRPPSSIMRNSMYAFSLTDSSWGV